MPIKWRRENNLKIMMEKPFRPKAVLISCRDEEQD